MESQTQDLSNQKADLSTNPENQEASKQATQVAKEASKEVANEASKEVANEASKEVANETSKEASKETKLNTKTHKLQNKWILWYHDGKSDWTLKSYQQIYEITTVEDFCRLYNNIPSIVNCMFFLMKDGYPPIWECPQNIKGGSWLYKFPKKIADSYWLRFSCYLIGETIMNNLDDITGISISPKIHSTTIRVWNKNSQECKGKVHFNYIYRELIKGKPLYKEFVDPDRVVDEGPVQAEDPNAKREVTNTIKYDYDTIMNLNQEELLDLDPKLMQFFSNLAQFPITKDMRFYYPNKYNMYFNRSRKKPQALINNDPEVIKNIRSKLSKVSDSNLDQVIQQMNVILTETKFNWAELAYVFYESAIENIGMLQTYCRMFIKLEETVVPVEEEVKSKSELKAEARAKAESKQAEAKPESKSDQTKPEAEAKPETKSDQTKPAVNKINRSLVKHLHHLIQKQVFRPKEFQDTITETGVNRHKRCQIHNAMIICEIYKQKKYSQDFMLRMIQYWLSNVDYEHQLPLEILVKILPLLNGTNLVFPEDIQKRVKEIVADKTYPARLRLILVLPNNKPPTK